jgi:hypothetical protein
MVGNWDWGLSDISRTKARMGWSRAFEIASDERRSVPDKDFVAIALDIPSAVFTVLGVWPEILALRPQFVQFLPGFDMTKFDTMPTYALALMRANTEYADCAGTPQVWA